MDIGRFLLRQSGRSVDLAIFYLCLLPISTLHGCACYVVSNFTVSSHFTWKIKTVFDVTALQSTSTQCCQPAITFVYVFLRQFRNIKMTHVTADPIFIMFTTLLELGPIPNRVGLNLTYGVYCHHQSTLSEIVLPLTNDSTEHWKVIFGIECT